MLTVSSATLVLLSAKRKRPFGIVRFFRSPTDWSYITTPRNVVKFPKKRLTARQLLIKMDVGNRSGHLLRKRLDVRDFLFCWI